MEIQHNQVYNEDCLQFMKQLPDNYFDLIITDPPYGIGINKMNFVTSGAVKVGGAYRNDYSNHNTEWDDALLGKEFFDEMLRVSKNQIIFGAEHLCIHLPRSRCWLVWDKRVEDKYSNDFADCELAWTSFDKPTKMYRYLWSGMLQSEMGLHKEKRFHPTQKPVPLGRWILEKFAKEGDLIFDPFAGSGSFLVACKQKGFKFVGCEINKDYVEIIKRRLAQGSVADFIQPKGCPDGSFNSDLKEVSDETSHIVATQQHL